MRNGHCPKCNSTTVYSQPRGIFFHNPNMSILTGGIGSAVPYVSFVCTTCGYFENILVDPKKLAEVARTWQKVPADNP